MGIEKICRKLNEYQIKYLVVGGLASVLYGVPRTTVDIGITILPTVDNLKKTIKTLGEVGLAPEVEEIDDILGLTFRNDWELDMLVNMKQKNFERAWRNRTLFKFRGINLPVVPKEIHIATLKKLGRPRDAEDIKYLEKG